MKPSFLPVFTASFVSRLTLIVVPALLAVTCALGQQRKVVPTKPATAKPAQHANHKYKGKDTTGHVDPYTSDTLLKPIPLSRTFFHDKIDKEQIAIDKYDGTADTVVTFARNAAYTVPLSKAFLDDVDAMQVMIENMPAKGRDEDADNQQKIRYLKAVYDMLQLYRLDPKPDAKYYVNLVTNMDSLLIAVNENRQSEFAHWHPDVYTLDNGKELLSNRRDLLGFLYIRAGKEDPVRIVKRLSEFAGEEYAGDIITDAARIDPELIFNYATSTTVALKKAVYDTDDSLVHCIVKIVAESGAPLKALPFVGDLYHSRKTVAEIDAITKDPAAMFQNLVRLKLENDSIARHAYTSALTYQSLNYVRKMNELHEADSTARFQGIDGLPPAALYFIMVYGQDELYTSSFLGTFKKMMEHMAGLHGDQLLDNLHYDHFRTFIRMCAGYNTLSTFLGTMDDQARTMVMTRFIDGLGNGAKDDLDDAVDVADAFGSIRDPKLSAFLQGKVKTNLEQAQSDNNKKGKIVYSILGKLIEDNNATDNTAGAEATADKLNLPPINKVAYKDLLSGSGTVYQQVFFYGDKDGQDAYESFTDEFKKDKNWHIATYPNWITISSVKGNKVVIYANLPLKEPNDEAAINKLSQYLDTVGIQPSIMIHRGHSYHLPVTLSKLTPNARIVILGSCGGYNNLAAVLDRSPDAHIVSSKQTGVRAVNEPIIRELNIDLVAGKDVNWVIMWQELQDAFKNKPEVLDRFSDYVPPYKNLGAIFIKAYRKMSEQ